MLYPGTVTARSTSTPGPASAMTYTVSVHLDFGERQFTGVRPWVQQWPDEYDSVPYQLGTEVVCIEIGRDWKFLFPGQTPVIEECNGNP